MKGDEYQHDHRPKASLPKSHPANLLWAFFFTTGVAMRKETDKNELLFWEKLLAAGKGARVLCHPDDRDNLEGNAYIEILEKRFGSVPVFDCNYIEAGKIVIPEEKPKPIEWSNIPSYDPLGDLKWIHRPFEHTRPFSIDRSVNGSNR
ncbi:MAG: hypothetical protein OQK82_01345 [Candidatus Pacearchaeota archaeon]|nr:hypothetical protein [Candidatus Pacearchaeota archaeon]